MANGTKKLDIQKKQHRERGQVRGRERLGMLEKHADYVKRAKDYHSKQDRLRLMKEKASLRNKDEFYFGMVHRTTKRGVHIQDRGNEALPMDLVKVLKTQDGGYIRTQMAKEDARIQRIQADLDALLDDTTQKNRHHVVFVDDIDEVRHPEKYKAPETDTPSVRKHRPKKSKYVKALELEESTFKQETLAKFEEESKEHADQLREELEARQERLKQMKRAYRELELQRLLMGKGAKKELAKPSTNKDSQQEEGVATGARVWKWKAERRK